MRYHFPDLVPCGSAQTIPLAAAQEARSGPAYDGSLDLSLEECGFDDLVRMEIVQL